MKSALFCTSCSEVSRESRWCASRQLTSFTSSCPLRRRRGFSPRYGRLCVFTQHSQDIWGVRFCGGSCAGRAHVFILVCCGLTPASRVHAVSSVPCSRSSPSITCPWSLDCALSMRAVRSDNGGQTPRPVDPLAVSTRSARVRCIYCTLCSTGAWLCVDAEGGAVGSSPNTAFFLSSFNYRKSP
jgi:hypothetical protein